MNQLQEASQETLEALVTALDAREKETQAHSKRVSEYSVHLAGAMGVGGAELEVIRQGSMLHDIGKIGVPDRILLKPGSLSEDEWVEMRKHPEIGSWIVSGVESLKRAADIVISHHERFDGKGYPAAVSGQRIPLGARVFAVADCLDAILSDDPKLFLEAANPVGLYLGRVRSENVPWRLGRLSKRNTSPTMCAEVVI